MRKLTIGMCTYDDYEGVFFTIQALRMYHTDIMDQVEFIIIDNNPTSLYGNAVKNFTENNIKEPFQYIPFTEYSSTSLRNLIFENAHTPYVLCVDCHVLLQPESIKRLISYYDNELDKGNLLQGPLLYDSLDSVSTHFKRSWGAYMLGQWDTDPRYVNKDSEPFEIPSQGLGIFSCRKDSWLGFNTNFRGFGGEEVYIHDKFIANGKQTMCLPFLGWNHRFTRIGGPPYTNDLLERYRNYIIGHTELKKDISEIEEVFANVGTEDQRRLIREEVSKL